MITCIILANRVPYFPLQLLMACTGFTNIFSLCCTDSQLWNVCYLNKLLPPPITDIFDIVDIVNTIGSVNAIESVDNIETVDTVDTLIWI